MGGEASTPAAPKPPEPTMTDVPWRKVKGWDSSVRDELRDLIERLGPVTTDKLKLPFFNVVLTGQVRSGKSSFFNSMNNLMVGKIVSSKAEAGEAAESLTKQYRVYEIKPHPCASSLPWRICDTMGLDDNTTQCDLSNLIKAVEGHVPNKHKFTPGEDFCDRMPGYVTNPTLAEKAHCIAIVIDAKKISVMRDDMWNKLRSLRQSLISRNIPTYIILSHIDEACEEVSKDVKNVYRSIKIRNIVTRVGKQLLGLPENQIFPVMNYKQELDLNDKMDILLLYAMRQMLYACQGHIENQMY